MRRCAVNIADRLTELGIKLPDAMPAVANYLPFVRAGNMLSISGQISKNMDGSLITGRLGDDVSMADGQKAARICAINILSQINAAGFLEKVDRVAKLGGFVACTPEFTGQPLVINGASDLMVDVFGDRGRHSRSAVGVSALPLGVAVEIDALVQIAD